MPLSMLIPSLRNIVIQKAHHKRAPSSGVSPQSCHKPTVVVVCDMWEEEMKRSMVLLSEPKLHLHVLFIIFL